MRLVIQRARLLDPAFLAWTKQSYPETELLPEEDVQKNITAFRNIWGLYGDVILRFIEQKLHLQFPDKEIICHIVNRTPRDLSNPLILRARYTDREFLAALVHELVHIIFRENGTLISVEDLKKVFTVESSHVAKHIPVYAILLAMAEEMPEVSLKIEISENSTNVDYRRSLEYASTKGYSDIFKKIQLAKGIASTHL